MKDTTLFASSIDTTFEEDILFITDNNDKKNHSYHLENMMPGFSETSSLVNSLL